MPDGRRPHDPGDAADTGSPVAGAAPDPRHGGTTAPVDAGEPATAATRTSDTGTAVISTPDGTADPVTRASNTGTAVISTPRHRGPGPGPEQPPPVLPGRPPGLPWGIAILAAGLAVEAYANRTSPAPSLTMPGGLATAGPAGILVGWILTALGLALAGPGLTHLCGRSSRPPAPARSVSSPVASSWRRPPASAAPSASSARWRRGHTP
ncbi:hypothetical protein SALBM311S_06877 [Streptomyces alboniger]